MAAVTFCLLASAISQSGRRVSADARPSRLAAYFTGPGLASRSEEHTSELQSLMRISYAVFCLKKTKNHMETHSQSIRHKRSKYTVTESMTDSRRKRV